MQILLGLRGRHVWNRAILLGMVVFGVASGPKCALGQTSPSAPSPAGNPDRLPLTTSSPEAARLFEEGLRLSRDFHVEQALGKWREATRKDPEFAQAWAYLGVVSKLKCPLFVASEMSGMGIKVVASWKPWGWFWGWGCRGRGQFPFLCLAS